MGKRLQCIGLFLLLLLFFSQKLNAQAAGTPYSKPYGCTNVATQGQDFWLTFGNNGNSNYQNSYLALELTNGNNFPVIVKLTFTATGQSASYTVPAETALQVDLNNVTPAGGASTTLTPGGIYGTTPGDMRGTVYEAGTTATPPSTITTSNTLHITSPEFISVISFGTAGGSGGTLVLPVRIWGTEYYNFSYQAAVNGGYACQNVHMIIANQNNTHITITNFAGAVQSTATLQAGQVWYNVGTGRQDLTGMHITSDLPVAYFIHSIAARVSTADATWTFLYQQLMPVPQWGQFFLAPNIPQFNQTPSGISTVYSLVRVLASKDNTTVNFTSATAFADPGYTPANGYKDAAGAGYTGTAGSITLNKGQWTMMQVAGGQSSYCTITANNPIGVVEYARGGNTAPLNTTYSIGTGGTLRVSPVTARIYSVIISPFIPSPTSTSLLGKLSPNAPPVVPRHYILVIAPTANKNNILITKNGQNITASGTLTDAAAAVPNAMYPGYTSPFQIISAPTTWTDVPTPINGVLYSYIRYDFNYLTDRDATTGAINSYQLTDPNFLQSGGILVTQVGMGGGEEYTVNVGNGGCLISQ